MADQTFTVVEGAKSGPVDMEGNASIVLGNAAGTDYYRIPNDGKVLLVCIVGAAPKLLTFSAVTDKYGRTEALTVQPTANKCSVAGPFMPEIWNHADGCVIFKPAAGGLVTDKYLAVRIGTPT
jgi:hypothetical protein